MEVKKAQYRESIRESLGNIELRFNKELYESIKYYHDIKFENCTYKERLHYIDDSAIKEEEKIALKDVKNNLFMIDAIKELKIL